MHRLAEQLLKRIRKQQTIRAGERVAVAVSGGADSVALLRLMLELRSELGIVLSIAHVNHKLRGEASDRDEEFVLELARQHGTDVHLREAPVSAASSGIEAAARELRYAFFRELAALAGVTKIATAHTTDDQAETVLLRIFRGTGIRGLAGIHPRIVLEGKNHSVAEVVRPLLEFRRAALLSYLREIGQDWREDFSNQGTDFLRNRVRHRLLPVITAEFGDPAIARLGELAEIARAEEEHWRCSIPHPASHARHSSAPLALKKLSSLSLAAQRRTVRAWIEQDAPQARVSFRAIENILELTRSLNREKLELSAGWNVRRNKQELLLERSLPENQTVTTRPPADYQYLLPIPGAVKIPELAGSIEAKLVDPSMVPEEQQCNLLAAAPILRQITIRNWRPGDCFWPAHTKSPRKVKELLSDRHLTAGKKRWPVAVADDGRLVWLRGFPTPAALLPRKGASQAIWIRQTPL